MRYIEFSKGIKEIKNGDGEIEYYPYMIIDGKEAFFSEQGRIVCYDSYEDAEEYNED